MNRFIYPRIFCFFLLISGFLFAKEYNITGKVVDSDTKSPLYSANVLLYSLPDSSETGTATSKSGNFELNYIKPGSYILNIKFVGYMDYSKEITITGSSVDLGVILLEPGVVSTEEVIITGKMPIATQSGDTTVFNALAFKVNKDAVAEDLLKKVPGIQVDNGKLKAHGEEVKKVYIDGKTYMGDDPNTAIKNLPADVIEKIQVFDQQSEQSQFTGFNDGNTTKALNLLTRMKVHKGIFGKMFGGYGTDERYTAGGNYNLFNEDQRISFLGQLNNVNEQNFSVIDMLGVMGGPQGGPERIRSISSELFQTGRNGETDVKSGGLNFNDKYFGSLETGSSYFYNNTNNKLVSSLSRSYLNTLDGTTYNENSSSSNQNYNHRFNMMMNLDVDSMNTLRFMPSFSSQKNKTTSVTGGSTNSFSGPLNNSSSLNVSDLTAANLNGLLMYRHKFNTARRTMSLVANGSLRGNKGNKKNYSKSVYYNTVGRSDTIDQSSDINNRSGSIQTDIVFTEPVTTNSMLSVTGSVSFSGDKNDKQTFNFLQSAVGYNDFDTALSNVYRKSYINRNAGAGWSYRKKKFYINAGLTYNMSTLSGKQEFPEIFEVERDFYSLQPMMMLNYTFSGNRNISVFYRTFANAPSASQLQNVVDNSNPLQLTTGNPALKQEYSHNITFKFSTTDYNYGSSFFLMAGGSLKSNNIGTKTFFAMRDTALPNGVKLNSGSQLSYPENYNGYYSLQSFMSYGIPVEFISSTVNLNLSTNYTNNPGMLNGFYNKARTGNFGAGFTISSNISTNVDFTLSSSNSLNQIRNTADKGTNDDYFSQNNSLRFYWYAFERITFSADFTHRYVEGLSSPSSFLLNFGLGTKLFEDRKGEIKLSVYDALNQNNNNTKTTTDTYTQEYKTNISGRYYLITFIYNLNSFM